MSIPEIQDVGQDIFYISGDIPEGHSATIMLEGLGSNTVSILYPNILNKFDVLIVKGTYPATLKLGTKQMVFTLDGSINLTNYLKALADAQTSEVANG